MAPELDRVMYTSTYNKKFLFCTIPWTRELLLLPRAVHTRGGLTTLQLGVDELLQALILLLGRRHCFVHKVRWGSLKDCVYVDSLEELVLLELQEALGAYSLRRLFDEESADEVLCILRDGVSRGEGREGVVERLDLIVDGELAAVSEGGFEVVELVDCSTPGPINPRAPRICCALAARGRRS